MSVDIGDPPRIRLTIPTFYGEAVIEGDLGAGQMRAINDHEFESGEVELAGPVVVKLTHLSVHHPPPGLGARLEFV
jgi:hypothetical protein